MDGQVEVLEHRQEAPYGANGVCEDQSALCGLEEEQRVKIEILVQR